MRCLFITVVAVVIYSITLEYLWDTPVVITLKRPYLKEQQTKQKIENQSLHIQMFITDVINRKSVYIYFNRLFSCLFQC